MPIVTNLFELLNVAPPENTAVILPESGIRVSYKGLREQVMTMADSLAAAGIGRRDRVATCMPNGLPAIVTFLAATLAGTAAPLNPGYRRDEFSFYLEDTAAKVLLCPSHGAEDARQAAEGRVPVYSVEMDEKGLVRLSGVASRGSIAQTPRADDVALVLHTSGSTGRPKRVPIHHGNVGASAENIATPMPCRPAMSRCASCRYSTSTGWSRRCCQHSFQAEPLWCRRSSALFLSGDSRATPGPLGIRRFPQFISSSLHERAESGRRAPKTCASSAPAVQLCPLR